MSKFTEHKYILVGKKIVPEKDFLKWAKWFESANRVIERNHIGRYLVSTVFLGIDHNFWGKGKPVLFETMVFGGKGNGDMEGRYTNFASAIKGHNIVVKKLKRKYE